LRHGADGFTFPPKEGVLWNFIAFKNALPKAGCEQPNLGSNGKHANNYATEDESPSNILYLTSLKPDQL
jgi:hypothetical protein